MFRLVLKKIAANRWLSLCLFAGMLLSVALVTGIPLYTAGILQRMLTRDLELYQESTNQFPGRYNVSLSFYFYSPHEASVGSFEAYDLAIRGRIPAEIGIPALAATSRLTVDYLVGLPEVRREQKPVPRYFTLDALEGAAGKLRLLRGRLPAKEPVDGAIEVVATAQAAMELDLRLDEVYTVTDARERLAEPLRLRLVGVFTMADPGDPWWFEGLREYDTRLLADYDLMRAWLRDGGYRYLCDARWSFALDYHAIKVPDLRRLLGAFDRQIRAMAEQQIDYQLPMLDTLRTYFDRERVLTRTLWFLQVPVFLMLAFFVFMTSSLIVRHDADEIAVLKSRGARSSEVFLAYLLQGLMLAAAAVAVGPFAGFAVAKIVGAANGFLEFVQRTALPIRLEGRAWAAAAACAFAAVAALLGPAWGASRTTIVVAKQRRSRTDRAPLWRRAFLDVILLAVAAYGYYGYRTQQQVLALTRATAGSLPMDPLLFLISALFIVGAGLLALRLYPLAISLVYRLGRRAWPPGLYATFLTVARSGGREQFLMLFLVLTLGIGVLDAKTARTLNRNIEERIRYATGADVTLREEWPSNRPAGSAGSDFGVPAGGQPQTPIVWREPEFEKYRRLDGVAFATRVFRQPSGSVSVPGLPDSSVELLGIVPHEFAEVGWFRPGLLPGHANQYLNLLSLSPSAMLVSEDVAEKFHLKPGDPLGVSWGDGDLADGIVYAVVPYWPSWNPHGAREGDEPTGLVVANLAHLQTAVGVEPYEVWMKLAPGADSEALYRQLGEMKVPLLGIENAAQRLVAARNDPLVQGTNGALTLGFTVTMMVTVIGFLIYWIISIQSRVLQFGVLRAMGMSRRRVLALIAWEQLLVSGVAVALGIAIGGLAGDVFVPLLQLTASASQQVPPFRVVAEPSDYARVYAVVGGMLAVGFAALGVFVFRLRVAEAMKLGEE